MKQVKLSVATASESSQLSLSNTSPGRSSYLDAKNGRFALQLARLIQSRRKLTNHAGDAIEVSDFSFPGCCLVDLTFS